LTEDFSAYFYFSIVLKQQFHRFKDKILASVFLPINCFQGRQNHCGKVTLSRVLSGWFL